MLCQLVCVDRRYQRMNCFNIREIQSLLKKRFFVDLINSHDHRNLLNQTSMGIRFKTNSINSIHSNIFSFYNFGIDFSPKIRSFKFNDIKFNDNYFNLNSFFFKLIQNMQTFFFLCINNLYITSLPNLCFFYDNFSKSKLFLNIIFKTLILFDNFLFFVYNLFNNFLFFLFMFEKPDSTLTSDYLHNIIFFNE